MGLKHLFTGLRSTISPRPKPIRRVQQWTRRRRRKHFKSKAVSCKLDTNTATVILCFFGANGEISETQELFPKVDFTHKLRDAYLPLFMGSWNMKEYLDSDIFWLGDRRICEGVSPLRFGATDLNLSLFLLYCIC